MKKWFSRNFKTIIITSFLIPIITIAIVSISHVTKWYEISNPLVWSQYLSFGIEIAALSALAAISTNIGKKVYIPFILVTLIQFIGNVFYSYLFIDIKSVPFLSWVELISPLLNIFGIEPTDLVSHKRFLSFMEGGILPIISLSFLHMLVLYSEEIKQTKLITPDLTDTPIPDLTDTSTVEYSEPPQLLNEDKIDNVDSNEEDMKKYSENYIKVPSHFLYKVKESEKINEDTSINDRIKASLANRILNRHRK
jgi:hypothetical protein